MRHGWLMTLFMLMAAPAPALAGTTAWADPNAQLCRDQYRQVHRWWQHSLFAVSPAVSRAMLAAFEGRTTDMRRDLDALPAAQRARWRRTALATAVAGNQPGTVAALLDDGVDPDSRGWVPPFSSAFFEATLGQLEHKPIFHGHGKQTVKAMQKQGLIDNSGEYLPPALFQVSQCHFDTVAKVLLAHGASATQHMSLVNGKPGPDPLLVAVVEGDAPLTRLLLAHGADADICADDRRMAQRARAIHRQPASTLADIGHKQGLPDALVARLQCRGR